MIPTTISSIASFDNYDRETKTFLINNRLWKFQDTERDEHVYSVEDLLNQITQAPVHVVKDITAIIDLAGRYGFKLFMLTNESFS